MGIWDTIKDTAVAVGTGGMMPAQGMLAGKAAKKYGPGILKGIGDSLDRSKKAEELYGGVDPEGHLGGAAGAAAQFGRTGAANYGQATRNLTSQTRDMRQLSDQYGQLAGQYGQQFGGIADRYGRIASGQDSISAEQLRQGLQQNQAAQMSMAAGARPGNAAMAARTAAMNMSRQGMGMSGQAAMAGLQERRDALGAQLGALGAGSQAQQGFMGGQSNLQGAIQQGLLTGRGQDVNATLGGQQGALQGYGGIEQARTNRYNALMGMPAPGEHALNAIQGGLQAYATYQSGGAAKSDRRAKKDIVSGDDDAEELLKGLKAYRYRYKDEADGQGEFVGPMAQDLEKTRAGRSAVMTGPDGKKVVHGARLSLALAAAAGVLDKRLSKLEGKGK